MIWSNMQLAVCTKRDQHVAVHHYGFTKGGNHYVSIHNYLDENGKVKWNMCFPEREAGVLDAIYLGKTTYTFEDIQCKKLASLLDSVDFAFPVPHHGPHCIQDSEVIGAYVLHSTPNPANTAGNCGVYTLGKTMVSLELTVGLSIRSIDYWKYLPKVTRQELFTYHHINRRDSNYYDGFAAPKK